MCGQDGVTRASHSDTSPPMRGALLLPSLLALWCVSPAAALWVPRHHPLRSRLVLRSTIDHTVISNEHESAVDSTIIRDLLASATRARVEEAVARLPVDVPRPHQRAAVTAAVSHLLGGGGGGAGNDGPEDAAADVTEGAGARATVVLPPGAGKTLVGLWALEAMSPTGTSLVVLPTIPLIDQTLEAYKMSSRSIASGRTATLVVASDCADGSVQRTTDADDIATFLRAAVDGDGPSLILSTYKSLERVAEAQRLVNATIDVAVFDEAHVMTGRSHESGLGLDDAHITLPRRLFLTATPKRFGRENDARSMDDRALFGPEVHRTTHQQAVNAGIVAPLKLLAYNVSEAYADVCARAPQIDVLVAERNISRANAELAVAALDAFEKRNLSKAFSFHRTRSIFIRFVFESFVSHKSVNQAHRHLLL